MVELWHNNHSYIFFSSYPRQTVNLASVFSLPPNSITTLNDKLQLAQQEDFKVLTS